MGKGKTDEKIKFLLNENEKLDEEVNNWKRNYWNLEKKLQYNQLMNSDLKYSKEDFEEKIRPIQQENLRLQKELEIKNKQLQEKSQIQEKDKSVYSTQSQYSNQNQKNEKEKTYLPKKKNFQSYFGSYFKI